MSAPPDHDDRKILIGGGLLLLAMMAVAVLVSPAPQQGPSYPSSYLAAPGGAKAAYLLLKDLGYSVERWENPATVLPVNAQGTTLILAGPFVTPTQSDRQAVRNFLAAGGNVLTTGHAAGALIPAASGVTEKACDANTSTYPAVFPSLLTRGAPEITMTPDTCWAVPDSAPPALYAANGKAAALSYHVGRGRVIWWASSEPLTNDAIQKTGNLAVFLNAVGAPEGMRLLWDEYYHGYQGSLSSYLAPTPIPWALAQVGLLLLVVCATFARRRGPVRPVVVESRLSPLEFVETLGGLYHQAHACAVALGVACQRFRFLVAREVGVSPSLSSEQLCGALERRLGRKDARLRSTLWRCESALRDPALRDTEALRLVKQLHDHFTALWPAPRPRNR